MKTIWTFLNSKVGLLVMGFALTSLLGTFLTSRIEQAALEHQLKVSRLYEDRANAIRTLHDKLVDIESNLYNLYYNYRPIGISPAFVKPEDVVMSIRELRLTFEKSRIYFSSDLSAKLNAVCDGFEQAMRELETAFIKVTPNTAAARAPAFDQTRFSEYFYRSKEARGDLEEEFRGILGAK